MEGSSTHRIGSPPLRVAVFLSILLLVIAGVTGFGLTRTAGAEKSMPPGQLKKLGNRGGGLVIAAMAKPHASASVSAVDEDCTAGDGVCLFEHPWYGGRWVRFAGAGCYSDFNLIGFNDLASSIRFAGSYAGGGYVARLYEHTNYVGASSAFAMDDPDLGNDAIGDNRASSICVEVPPPSTSCVGDGIYLYEHTEYGGRCQKLTASLDNLLAVNFNDIASSVRLVGAYGGGAYRATLCEHSGYAGACSTFTGDDPDLRNDAVGNDRTSSVRLEPNSSTCPWITDWKGEYWNNKDLWGSPVMCRNDVNVNFEWGTGGPGGGVGNDNYSARWTRDLGFAGGRYRFHLRGDDGIRLWIDGNLVIDQWKVQARTEYTADRDLTAGTHSFRVEYFEAAGEANVALWWEQLSSGACPPITDWKGEYWNNKDLWGSPVMCRNDVNVNFEWGAGGPGGGVPNDGFSARWTRNWNFAQGRYRFHLRGDDGLRLWLDGSLIIDQWKDQARTEYTADRDLAAGTHSLRVEYYENGGDANVALWWEQVSTSCADYRAEYFNNPTLSGSALYTLCEAAPIDHNWGAGGPGGGIGNDRFSVRWTARESFTAGEYVFKARVDDGIRVWVGGTPLIDAWRDQAATEYTATRVLSAGDYDVRVEYYENGGDAVAQFWWQKTGAVSGVVISNKPAFDTCRLPLASEMKVWWDSSPYYEANIYLGGVSRACEDWNRQHLTSSWVQTVHAQGWNFIPTWVGPQAPCNTSGLAMMSSDSNTAHNQGRVEADAAVNAAKAVGLTSLGTGQTVIYYAMAPYPNVSWCRNTVKSFMSGWVGRLRELGMKSGGYGASCGSFVSDWASIPNVPDNIWPATANWPAYDPAVTVWNVGGCVSNGLWVNHQRIFQYTLGHNEWWGSTTLNINSNIADGQVAGTHARLAQAAGASATLSSSGPEILAAELVTSGQGWMLTRDRLLWSSDGGGSWNDITPAGAGAAGMRGAEFIDPEHGWVVYAGRQDDDSSPDGLMVARTEDGGRSWASSTLVSSAAEQNSGLGNVSLSFVDALTGRISVQAATGSNFSQATLFETRDGGATWTAKAMPVAGRIRFVSPSMGWVAGGPAGDELYVTRNAGDSWEAAGVSRSQAGAATRLYGLPSFGDENNGVLPVTIADEARPRVEFYRTSDGGATWELAAETRLDRQPAAAAETSALANNAWVVIDPGSGDVQIARPGGTSFRSGGGTKDSAGADGFGPGTGWAIKRYGSCRGDKEGGTGEPFTCEQHAELVRTVDGGATWEVVRP